MDKTLVNNSSLKKNKNNDINNNFADINNIKYLIEYIKNTGLEEVFIETAEITIKVKRSASNTNNISENLNISKDKKNEISPKIDFEQKNNNVIEVKSPMIGTFYISSNPQNPPFVKEGDIVKKGQTLCIIEAMKLFNEIEAEVSGKIEKILIKNSTPVEYDQPLFLISPE